MHGKLYKPMNAHTYTHTYTHTHTRPNRMHIQVSKTCATAIAAQEQARGLIKVY